MVASEERVETLTTGRPGAGNYLLAAGAIYALVRLALAFRRLTFPAHEYDAGDLLLRFQEVAAWFRGLPVYGVIGSADYPPASYLLFRPFLGFTGFAASRWIWAGLTLVLLFWLVRIMARESGPRRPLRTLVLLLPFAGYASYATIVNGQVTILVVTLVTAGVVKLTRGSTLRSDFIGSLLVAASLIKPTLSVPLVWVAFLATGRIRPFILITGFYAAFTFGAAAFQNVALPDLMRGWLAQSSKVNLGAASLNLQGLLAGAGLDSLFLPAVLGLCLLTGAWVFRYRSADRWLLLAVTAMVALFWTYHRPFDDLLMLLPAVALLRITARQAPTREGRMASALGWTVALLALTHPQLGLITHGLVVTNVETIVFAFDNVRNAAFVATLVFLVRQAHLDVHMAPAPESEASAHAAKRRSIAVTDTGSGILATVCFATPLVVLAGAYAWMVVHHGQGNLAGVIVHESGEYTLGETILYTRHFLREVPTLLSMALFVIAATGGPPAHANVPSERRSTIVSGLLALGAAALLIVVSFGAVSSTFGMGEAARNLIQSYTRDDVIAYGSHWRFHWLSTLWFALAARFVVHVAARWLGGPPPAPRGARFERLAWVYYLALTVVFGFSLEPFLDPRFLGHQAREILTHGLVTLPLALGVLALAARRDHGPPEPLEPLRQSVVTGVFAIPLYLGAGVLLTNAMRTGQTGGGLSAMVGAHFYEHVMDYVLVALIVAGGYRLYSAGIRVRRFTTDPAERRPPSAPRPVARLDELSMGRSSDA